MRAVKSKVNFLVVVTPSSTRGSMRRAQHEGAGVSLWLITPTLTHTHSYAFTCTHMHTQLHTLCVCVCVFEQGDGQLLWAHSKVGRITVQVEQSPKSHPVPAFEGELKG